MNTRLVIVLNLLVATVWCVPVEEKSGQDLQGTCHGTCVDIRAKPSCDGYIHLGQCLNGLGCCSSGGVAAQSGGQPAPASAPAPASVPAPENAASAPAPNPVPASPSGGRGTCQGNCVDIKQKPSCSGYIHYGMCDNGLGCCIDSGPGREIVNDAKANPVAAVVEAPPATQNQVAIPAAQPAPNQPANPAAPSPSNQGPEDIQGSCQGTCVDIKKNPTCSGPIHLNQCKNGYGCCRA